MNIPWLQNCFYIIVSISGDHFVHAPCQWEKTLHCNVVSHWLDTHRMIPAQGWPLMNIFSDSHSSKVIIIKFCANTLAQTIATRPSSSITNLTYRMCTFLLQHGALCDMGLVCSGNGSKALWNLCNRHLKGVNNQLIRRANKSITTLKQQDLTQWKVKLKWNYERLISFQNEGWGLMQHEYVILSG